MTTNDHASHTLGARLRDLAPLVDLAPGHVGALAAEADALQRRAEEAEAKVAAWESWADDGTEAEAPAKVQAPALHDYAVREALGEI